MDDKNMSLIEHLSELRKVLVISVISILLGSIASYFLWGEQLFQLATDPLEGFDVALVYISMTEAFITRIKLSLVAGVVLVSPIVFWQIWSYIVPALHRHEKRLIMTILPASIGLFAFGILFAYFTVFRFAAGFLLLVAGEGLEAMISVSRYVSFLLGFILPFGFIFQLPLVILFLVRVGIVSTEALIEKRKYVIVSSFVLGAILTPPDIISQVFMAVPLVLLFEISIILSRFIKPKKIDYDDDLLEEDEETE